MRCFCLKMFWWKSRGEKHIWRVYFCQRLMLKDGKYLFVSIAKHACFWGKIKTPGASEASHLCETHLVVRRFISLCLCLFPVSAPEPRLMQASSRKRRYIEWTSDCYICTQGWVHLHTRAHTYVTHTERNRKHNE